MKLKLVVRAVASLFALTLLVTGCGTKPEGDGKNTGNNNRPNNYISQPVVTEVAEGYQWPEGRVLPKFATPEKNIDTIKISYFTKADEKAMMAVLQGIVNAKKPRILLVGNSNEKWPEAVGLEANVFNKDTKYDLIKKYIGEISGAILIDSKKSIHYINLGCTVGGLKKALPMTQTTYDKLKEEGIELPIVEDLTKLEYTTPVEIYNHLYEKYWPQCTKRLVVSLSPKDHIYYTRDMAAATGAAVVWLDNQKAEEKEVMVKFFKDMEPGKSLAIGWYTEERSGIGAGTENGISTVPADYFENSTVYGGTPEYINIPKVPNKPELENKIYVALFLSDGDNVQYNQHVMKTLWDNKERGSVPINWTISPSLVDFAPGILNTYYKTASDNDFFASGPSGLGYALVVDRLNDRKGEGDVNFTTQEHIDAYTKLSNNYLERSGIRVITIWDEVKDMHMESYAKNARYLYGNTYQDWIGSYANNSVQQTYIKQNKMSFIPNNPCYTSKVDEIVNSWTQTINNWKGDKPLFFSAQGNAWFFNPANIKAVSKKLNELKPGMVEVLRGDHFFELFNEANGLPINLAISEKLKVEGSNTANVETVMDGTPSGDIWSATGSDKWLKFDLGAEYEISRYVIRHAGSNNQKQALNTKDFTLEVSMDGSTWTVADKYVNNTANVTDIDIDPVKAKYARLIINNAGEDGIARIAEVELYAKVVK